MALLLNGALVVLIVASFLMLSHLLQRTTTHSSKYHVMLCIALLFYAVGYLMEVNAANEAGAMAGLLIENMGIPAIGPFFLLCMLQLCDSKLLRPWMGYVASLHVLFVFLVVLFTGTSGIYYSSITVVQNGWARITLGHGPLYYYNQALSILCVLPAFYVLGKRYLKWTGSMRKRMTLILVGSCVTLVANAANVLGLSPSGVDITVFAFGITMICFFIAVRQNRLYELQWLGASRAAQTMEDAMVVVDSDGGLAYYNNTASRLFPALCNVNTNTPINQVPGLPELFYHPLVSGSVDEKCNTTRGERHFRCSVSNIDEDGWSIVLRDTTQTVLLTHKLEELAEIDDLTNVYNRRHFMELLQYELMRIKRHPEKACLIMFDIDYFKRVNDTYGHAAGDETLTGVAEAVKQVLRASDLFGRYGGEEFLIFCPFTGGEEALNLAERIRQVISQTVIEFDGVEIRVNASFGITEIQPEDEIDTLIDHADQAMYSAKKGGRNRVNVYEEIAS